MSESRELNLRVLLHIQGFQTTGHEPFVGNKNIESVVTSIYRNY